MVALHRYMEDHFANWQDDLPQGSGWPAFFEQCEAPAFRRIPAHHVLAGDDADHALVWPGRRDARHLDAPRGSHICRAFENLEPEDVRVVVLGQDPYRTITEATGRAFEDGTWNVGDRPQDLAKSLKPLMLAAWATQPDRAQAFRRGGWSELVGMPGFALPNPGAHFDVLAGEGVLFLNAAWTRTGDEHLAAHRDLWKPVMTHLLRWLTWRNGAPIVFLLHGTDARSLFQTAVGRHFRQDSIGGITRLATVYTDHPAYQGGSRYFACGNPFTRVNDALEKLGDTPITWWPPAEPGA